MKNKRITSKKYKYIFFPSDLEVYQLDPYNSATIKKAFADEDVKSWRRVKVVIGEDLKDLGYRNIRSERGYESSWYIANDDVPSDHLFDAVVGIRKSLNSK